MEGQVPGRPRRVPGRPRAGPATKWGCPGIAGADARTGGPPGNVVSGGRGRRAPGRWSPVGGHPAVTRSEEMESLLPVAVRSGASEVKVHRVPPKPASP